MLLFQMNGETNQIKYVSGFSIPSNGLKQCRKKFLQRKRNRLPIRSKIGTWEFLEKPNDDDKRLRYGVWFEEITITIWVATIRNDALLFAYISISKSIHSSFYS
ncbi:hypothetical protein [Neobacillus massiliamazoniensis]|uniref:hypothetical protein n=1 Tax=Neobacillus massiliamazoniensis TaxID=1499688 RepID=UPI000B836BA4|nr:hypothetical protein [Neobacillus massiliamazoniensis]